MTAEAITANDVTAIDAVTGDASNMAADVDSRRPSRPKATDGTTTGRGRRPRARAGLLGRRAVEPRCAARRGRAAGEQSAE